MDPAIEKRLKLFIKSKGLRNTPQRDAIVKAIFSSDEHFNVDELWDRIRHTQSKSSRATVYRTVSLLVEAGLLHEIDLGEDQKTYDPNFIESPAHNHLVCIDCGKIVEFEDENIQIMNECAARRQGFTATRQTLKIDAYCDTLRKHGSCPSMIEVRIQGKRLPKQ